MFTMYTYDYNVHVCLQCIYNQGRIFIISLRGVWTNHGGFNFFPYKVITGSLGGASRRLTPVNFSLT